MTNLEMAESYLAQARPSNCMLRPMLAWRWRTPATSWSIVRGLL
jgi:hypothetical protein